MRSLAALVLLAGVIAFGGCATVSGGATDIPVLQDKASGGDEAAVRALVGLLRSGERAKRDDAYKAIVASGKTAVPVLLEELSDPDPAIREYAAAALGESGDARAVKPLLDMLQNENVHKYIAAWGLGKLKAESAAGPLIGCLAVKNDALQKEATRALIAIGEPAVPSLIAAFDSTDSDTRKFAARALGIIEDKRAEAPLVKRLSDENDDVAAAAALALGTAGTKDCVPALVAALKARHIVTRVNAEISLGTLEAKEAVGPLTDIVDNDDDPYVREWAARALENITGDRHKYKDDHGVMAYPYNLYR